MTSLSCSPLYDAALIKLESYMNRIALLAIFAFALTACSSDDAETTVEDVAADAVETAEEVAAATEDAVADAAASLGICLDAGPQTPRDISNPFGTNPVTFPVAPAAEELNLCNIHTHTNAEHKGPGFSIFVNDTDSGGYACNDTENLTDAERAPLDGAYKGAKPGDTIEVHWVHTSCPVTPGEGLGSCLTDTCTDPLLRVEAQTFLVVNDENAPSFLDYAYDGTMRNGFHQAKAIPSDTGEPVEFLGSTTGPSYTEQTCSPMKVTWSVRPQCKKISMQSLHLWAEQGNVFNETKSHGVRQLVTSPELLSPIE